LNHPAETLDPTERRRAESFHFGRDRDRFIAAHGTLRTILGRYLQAQPATIRFEYGSYGKPFLAGHFALSALHGAQEMATFFCSPSEIAQFQAVPRRDKESAFFRLWTRKETSLKATGTGIGQALDKVEVCFRSGEPPRLIGLPADLESLSREWSLQELTPAPGYIAALALPGQAAPPCCWHWQEEDEFEYAQF